MGGGYLADTVSKLIDEYGLNDYVNMLGEIRHNQMMSYYYNADVFVMPSLRETGGTVLIEAMAYGLPVVSFACPCGPKEIIVDGVDGFLVEPQNIKELACKISYVIENEEIRKTMGYQASVNVHRYDIERIVPRWVQLFEELTI